MNQDECPKSLERPVSCRAETHAMNLCYNALQSLDLTHSTITRHILHVSRGVV